MICIPYHVWESINVHGWKLTLDIKINLRGLVFPSGQYPGRVYNQFPDKH